MTIMSRWIFSSVALSCLLGCAEKEIEKAFEQVQTSSQGRLGKEIVWVRDSESEQKIAEALTELLADELTADEAVRIALLSNRRLQATYAEVGIAAAQVVEAWLIENPTLNTQIRFAHNRPFYEMEVVQNFLDVLLLPLAVAVSEAQLEATKARVTAEVIQTAADTRKTFYRYQARLQLLHYWQGVLLSAESAYEMALQLRRAGNISDMRLAQEQAAYEQLKMDVAETELAAVQDRERLNILMGLWGPATAWRAKPELPDVSEEWVEIPNAESQAIQASLDLESALYNLSAEAQRLGLESIQAVIPSLALGVAIESERPTEYRLDKVRQPDGTTEYELEERTMEEWQVGPQFAVPLPIWNWEQAAYATGQLEILRRWNLYTALAIDIRASARAAEFRLRTAHQRVLFTRKMLLPVWSNVFEQTHLQYNAMFVGVFDLLRAKQDQLRAHLRYVEALAEYWDARTDLDQLLLGSAEGAGEFEENGAGKLAGGMQNTLSMVQRQAEAGRDEQRDRNGGAE